MPSFDADREEIIAFESGDKYLFSKYFDKDPLFNQLEKYHQNDKYRFEIPEDGLEQVRQILDEYLYDLVIEDSWEDYLVATDKETDSSTILRNSVMKKRQGQNDIFLMKDKLPVEQALEDIATPTRKIRYQQGGTHMENRRIIAGPTVTEPARTSRYKYLPLSNIDKSILQ